MSELFSGSMKARHHAPRLAPHPAMDHRHLPERLLAAASFSKHAMERMGENELTEDQLDLIIRYSTWYRARHDRTVYEVPDSPFLILADPKLPDVRNMALVISDDWGIVSVYQKDWRFREGELK